MHSHAGNKICKACPLKDKCIPTKTSYKSLMRLEDADSIIKYKVLRMESFF